MRFTTLMLAGHLFRGDHGAGRFVTLQVRNGCNRCQRLLKEMKANARHIDSCARQIESLARTQNAQWSDYDRQWNLIKPAQERIDLETQRLERVQASLSAPEQHTLAQTRRDAKEITSATHDLWLKIGQSQVDLKPRALNADSRQLDKATGELIKATGSTS